MMKEIFCFEQYLGSIYDTVLYFLSSKILRYWSNDFKEQTNKKGGGKFVKILVCLDFDCINNKATTWSNTDLNSEKL